MIDIQNGRREGQTNVFLFLSNTHRYGDVGIPAGLFIAGTLGHDQQMRQNSLLIGSGTALSYGLDCLIKYLVKRPRPFIQNLNIVPVYRAGGTSFPSGHAACAFAIATSLVRAYPKWYVAAPVFYGQVP